MSRRTKWAIISAIGVIGAAVISIVPEMIGDQPRRPEERFVSPDERFQAARVRSGWLWWADEHYRIEDLRSRREFHTSAKYPDRRNIVKAGGFSDDSARFGAVYHYGHAGDVTWYGIWNVQTGQRVCEWEEFGFRIDAMAAANGADKRCEELRAESGMTPSTATARDRGFRLVAARPSRPPYRR